MKVVKTSQSNGHHLGYLLITDRPFDYSKTPGNGLIEINALTLTTTNCSGCSITRCHHYYVQQTNRILRAIVVLSN